MTGCTNGLLVITIGRHIERTCPTIERRSLAAKQFPSGAGEPCDVAGLQPRRGQPNTSRTTPSRSAMPIWPRTYFSRSAAVTDDDDVEGRLPRWGATKIARGLAHWQTCFAGAKSWPTVNAPGGACDQTQPPAPDRGPHPMSDLRKIIIDGREIEVDPAMTLIQACEQTGIEIPRFLLSRAAQASPAIAGCAWSRWWAARPSPRPPARCRCVTCAPAPRGSRR